MKDGTKLVNEPSKVSQPTSCAVVTTFHRSGSAWRGRKKCSSPLWS
jgi:hypothetical protein